MELIWGDLLDTLTHWLPVNHSPTVLAEYKQKDELSKASLIQYSNKHFRDIFVSAWTNVDSIHKSVAEKKNKYHFFSFLLYAQLTYLMKNSGNVNYPNKAVNILFGWLFRKLRNS